MRVKLTGNRLCFVVVKVFVNGWNFACTCGMQWFLCLSPGCEMDCGITVNVRTRVVYISSA